MRTPKTYWTYILANQYDTVLYVGVTSDLFRRLEEHRAGTASAFTARYRVCKLVHAESFAYVHDAIAREKEVKAWRREKKLGLIWATNPEMADLSGAGLGDPSLRSG